MKLVHFEVILSKRRAGILLQVLQEIIVFQTNLEQKTEKAITQQTTLIKKFWFLANYYYNKINLFFLKKSFYLAIYPFHTF